jgi:exodeoxyribonuclease-3
MKIVSWNVNGIRAVINKGFFDFLKKENPDIICVQETKAHPSQVEISLAEYPYKFWNSAEKRGYAGTAVFSKKKPLSVTQDIGIQEHDQEGRVLTLEYKNFFLVNVYVPNSKRGLLRLDYRKKWDKDLLHYLKNLEKIYNKPIIFCGDLNVAHKGIDLANPKNNYNKNAGFTQIEIDGLNNFLDYGFIDSFRKFNKSPGNYTWWSYMFNARAKNVGWRIDYFLVSKFYMNKVKSSDILSEVFGSDHCPIRIILE